MIEIRDTTDKWNILNNKEDKEVVIWRRFTDRLVTITINDSGSVAISNVTHNFNSTFLKFTTLEELIEMVK